LLLFAATCCYIAISFYLLLFATCCYFAVLCYFLLLFAAAQFLFAAICCLFLTDDL